MLTPVSFVGADPGPLTAAAIAAEPPDIDEALRFATTAPADAVVPGGGANSLVRVTNEGVILIDTKLPGEANYNGLMEQIRSVTPQPVKIVIVTHHHADHTGNNDRFIAAGAQVIGHEQLAKNLDTYQFDPRPAKPNKTYTTSETVKLGGAEVRVLHLAAAHTGGDVLEVVEYGTAEGHGVSSWRLATG